jgi:molecular chaperone DnaK (HSP70)
MWFSVILKSDSRIRMGDDQDMNDEKFKRIQEQIDIQKTQLLQNLREMVEKSKENEYLTDMQEEYNKHMSKLEQKKQRQIKSFQLLIEHLRNLTQDDKLSKPDMDNVKNDLKQATKELKKIMSENFS